MRNKIAFFVLFALLFSFIACNSSGVGTPGEANLWVVNSAWKVVAEYDYSARAINSLEAVENMVETYNRENAEDQLTIIDDPSDLDIENAPDARILIVYADNLEVYCDNTFPREKLEYERNIARNEVKRLKFNSPRGAILYIDDAAPEIIPPYVPPVIDRYAKYSMYVLDVEGNIVWEEHITDYYFDDDFACDVRLNMMIQCWRSGAPENWASFVHGYIYVKPEPPEEPPNGSEQ